MKTMTTLSIVAITALFIGCGGGGGGGATPNQGTSSSIAAGGTSSSAADGSTSSQASQGTIQFDARNLSGNTVFIEDTDNIIVDDKEYIYIFETDSQVKLVLNRDNGEQIVHENGTYEIKDSIGLGKNVDINFILSDGTSSGFTLFLEDDYSIKEYQLGAHVTKVLPNGSNGVVIKENTPVSGAFNITSANDVKGYTFTSTEGAGKSTITVSFNCNGTFDEQMKIKVSGTTITTTRTGDDIQVRDETYTHRLQWTGTDGDGDIGTNALYITNNDQLVVGQSCFSESNCANGWYLDSITKDSTCN